MAQDQHPRIRSADLVVPSDDPFENDLLGRRPAVESLTRILASSTGPCVVSVDAEWGSGKTVFLRMWSQHLQNAGFHVIQFNAWETDFTNNPLHALTAELTRSLAQCSDPKIEGITRTLRESASELAFALAKAGVRGAGALLPAAGPVAAEATVHAIDSMRRDPVSEYQQARDSIEKLKLAIGKASNALSSRRRRKPLVIAIDELDRCRPSYAIGLIETAKHIFSVDNVVFVLAINSSALEHSIKAVYGSAFDAEPYMRRFIDLQFRLPEHDRTRFMKALLKSAGLSRIIHTRTDEGELSFMLFTSFFADTKHNLRDIEQAARRLGLILQLLDDVQPWMMFSAVVGLILRAAEPDLYSKFLHDEAKDEEILETLFANLSLEQPRLTETKAKLEGAVIAVTQPRVPGDTGMFSELTSPLIRSHRRTLAEIDPTMNEFTEDQKYSIDVTEYARDAWSGFQLRDARSQLTEAMQFLELLLPGYSSVP